LISKSSFSRQCIGRIRDTCSQLTWKLHSGTHTQRHCLTYPNPCSNFVSTQVMPKQAQIWSLSTGDVAFWYPHCQFIGRIHDTCSQLTWNLQLQCTNLTHELHIDSRVTISSWSWTDVEVKRFHFVPFHSIQQLSSLSSVLVFLLTNTHTQTHTQTISFISPTGHKYGPNWTH